MASGWRRHGRSIDRFDTFPSVLFKIVSEDITASLSFFESAVNNHSFTEYAGGVFIPGLDKVIRVSVFASGVQKFPLIGLKIKCEELFVAVNAACDSSEHVHVVLIHDRGVMRNGLGLNTAFYFELIPLKIFELLVRVISVS